MGGGGGATQQTSQETKLPDWVDDASKSNYERAQQVANNLQGPYTGNRVAGLTGDQQANIAAAQANVGSTNNAYGVAQDATRNFLNFNGPQVQAGQLANTDLAPYMNPYTQAVTNYGLQALDQQRMQALNQTGAQAQQARAFGGSRQGVQEAVTNTNALTAAGTLAANYGSQNFLNAQQQAAGDIGRRYQADVQNQGNAMQSAQYRMNAANQLGTLATQGQQSFLSGLDSAQGYGTLQQQQQQAQLDAARQLYGEQGQLPIQRLQLLQSALANSPYGKTVTGQQPGPADNTGMQIAGLGIAAAGTVAMFM